MLNTLLQQSYSNFQKLPSSNPLVEEYNEIIKNIDHETSLKLDNIVMQMVAYETQRYYRKGFLNGINLITDILKKR